MGVQGHGACQSQLLQRSSAKQCETSGCHSAKAQIFAGGAALHLRAVGEAIVRPFLIVNGERPLVRIGAHHCNIQSPCLVSHLSDLIELSCLSLLSFPHCDEHSIRSGMCIVERRCGTTRFEAQLLVFAAKTKL